MFRVSFDDDFGDELNDGQADETQPTPWTNLFMSGDVMEARSASEASETTDPSETSSPSALISPPPSFPASSAPRPCTARTLLTLTDLPTSTMILEDTENAQQRPHRPQYTYLPSRLAHTINPFHAAAPTGSQSADTPLLPAPPPLPLISTAETIDEETSHLLLPLLPSLTRLLTTTLPPPTSKLSAKSLPRVLSKRLLPVGAFVLNHIAGLEQHRRGAVELGLCEFIARYYWPQHLVRADALRVMEGYRNAWFLEGVRRGREGEEEKKNWKEEKKNWKEEKKNWKEEKKNWKEEKKNWEEEGRRKKTLDERVGDEDGEMPGLVCEASRLAAGADEFWFPVPRVNEELEAADQAGGGGVAVLIDSSWED